MAATENLIKKSLVLSVEEGFDDKNEPIVKRYSYSNIKTDAPAESLMETAEALSSLYKGGATFTTVDTNSLY